MNGSAHPIGLATSGWFQWGSTTNYGYATAPQPVGSGIVSTNFSQQLSNLATHAFHYRAIASNVLGVAVGSDAVFTLTNTFRAASGTAGGGQPIALGQPARVRTEAFPEHSFAGVVREIAPLGERVQNVTYFEVEIDIVDDESGRLRARMSGDADIVSEVIKNAVFVPETALRYRGDEIYVERVVRSSDARTEPVAIQIGVVDGSRVQVLSGIAEGDEVTLK